MLFESYNKCTDLGRSLMSHHASPRVSVTNARVGTAGITMSGDPTVTVGCFRLNHYLIHALNNLMA
jgi:hypothetical protein